MPKAVGVKQLKAKLSEYLRLVKSGETILVTDRDEVVAELRPARRQPWVPDDLDGLLDALADSAEITRASRPSAGWTWHVQGLGLPPGTAQRLLGEVRAERGSPYWRQDSTSTPLPSCAPSSRPARRPRSRLESAGPGS